MPSQLDLHEKYVKHRKGQRLSLRRLALVRNSVLTNSARDEAADDGHTIILSEGWSTESWDFLLYRDRIYHDYELETEKLQKELV